MRQLKFSLRAGATGMGEVLTRPQLQGIAKAPKFIDVVCVLLPLCAIILWATSLKYVNLEHMTALGLVSALPYSILVALAILMISFCLTLQQPQLRVSVLLLHLFLLIFMLYGITTLLESAPSNGTVYREVGYVEYIMHTGTVAPHLEPYFSWPGFFVLNAVVTRTAGFPDALSYAGWAPFFLNLIYLGPLYMIFTSATTDKRHVWLGLWFFYLTNWIGQDYFLSQGLNYFLYLVIIAILLKWFKVRPTAQPRRPGRAWQYLARFLPFARRFHGWLTAPDALYTPIQSRRRTALLVLLVVVFAFSVFSHPLTALFVTASVTALVIFRRCTPRWLPGLMAAMTFAWILVMARPYLATHNLFGEFGQVNTLVGENVTGRLVQGSPGHTFVAEIRTIMTVAVWVLAFVGGIRRLRAGYRDVTYILLAIAPFSLFVALTYGGEILQRIYLFALPLMVFFAAALFYISNNKTSNNKTSLWRLAAIAGMSLMLLGGFLFTRYGNEAIDYMTQAEVAGVRYLYSTAPPNSLLIEGWNGTPWRFQDEGKYQYGSLSTIVSGTDVNKYVVEVVHDIQRENSPDTYLIFTRTQKTQAVIWDGLPPGTLDRIEDALLKSGKFKLIYSNPDVQVFEYLH